MKSHGYSYEHGETGNHLLTHQLNSQAVSQLIPTILMLSGEITIDPGEINKTFATFYSKLYMSESSNRDIEMHNFFNNLQAPIMNKNYRSEIELPLQE